MKIGLLIIKTSVGLAVKIKYFTKILLLTHREERQNPV
jgi:hypothetical protein